MSRDVWKKFEENQLTHSAAHYLMTIRHLLDEHGYARVTDVAKALNITRGSASISLKPLKRKGLVKEDENKFLKLSREGQRLADLVEHNDQILEAFFREVLGVDPDQAEVDACKIEHLLSLETSVCLSQFIQCVQSGRPEVKAFLKLLRDMDTGCAHEAGNCELCQEICLYQPVEVAPARSPAASR